MKENKGLIGITIILIIIVLLLSGYIIYDKMNTKEIITNTSESLDSYNESIENETNNEVINTITSIKDFPSSNDSSVIAYGNIYTLAGNIDPRTNLKNKAVSIGNVSFTFNCEETDEETSNCRAIAIKVNDNTIYTRNFEYEGDTEENNYGYPYVLITSDYIVINKTWEGLGTDTLYIYKIDGTLVRTIDNTADTLILDESTDEKTDVQIILYNGKLYYVSTKDYDTAVFNYYDFANDTITEIEEFSAWTNQQA